MEQFVIMLGQNGISSLVPEKRGTLMQVIEDIVGGDVDEMVTSQDLKDLQFSNKFKIWIFSSKNTFHKGRNPFFPERFGDVALCLMPSRWNTKEKVLNLPRGFTLSEIIQLPDKFKL